MADPLKRWASGPGSTTVQPVPVTVRAPGSAGAEGSRLSCAAPSIQLRLDPNGLVTTCCKSLRPLGHISRNRLSEIWFGEVRRQIVAALAVDDFSEGCQRCGAEIAQEGREVSYAAIHDQWAAHLGQEPDAGRWPVRLELNLSNACNLQCLQCDGESSSAIRAHREHRPPLPKVYGDEFFDDLAQFLPHLDRIVFAGGEPFLGAENFRIWDMIVESGADIDCVVVTNATQWTPRIEALLHRLRFSFIFSIDGITKSTYESIRVGADFDQVMANVERFRAHAARSGGTVSVNHCLMPSNVHEFADLLLWAEQHDLHVDVSVVRTPAHASIARLPVQEIRRLSSELEARDGQVRERLSRNLATWEAERHRIAAWAATGGDDESSHSVMWFRCSGSGPTDDTSARSELAGWSGDGQVHSVEVGSDDLIRAAETTLAADGSLAGRHFQEFTKVVVAAFGDMSDYEVDHTDDDVVRARARFGSTEARIVTVALRDDRGWADRASINVAFLEPAPKVC